MRNLAFLLVLVLFTACQPIDTSPQAQVQLKVELSAADAAALGSVSSKPTGISAKIPNPQSASAQFNAGTKVTLTALPEANSYLDSWSPNCPAQGNSCTIQVNKNDTVTATFKEKPSLVVTKGGSGSGTVISSTTGISLDCGADCDEQVNPNTSITLEAQPDSGSVFKEWLDCDTPSGQSCTVTVPKTTKNVQAVFEKSTLPPAKPISALVDFSVLAQGEIPDDSSYCLPVLDPETLEPLENYAVLATFDWDLAQGIRSQSQYVGTLVRVLHMLELALIAASVADCKLDTAVLVTLNAISFEATSLCVIACTQLLALSPAKSILAQTSSSAAFEPEQFSLAFVGFTYLRLVTQNIVEFAFRNLLITFTPTQKN